MPLDPSISLGVKTVEMPNMLAQYGQLAQIQNAQQQNQLHQMQMEEYARARQEEEGVRNYLRVADLKSPEARRNLMQYGKTGLAYGKALAEQESADVERKAKELKLTSDRIDAAARIYGTVTDQPSWERARVKLASLGGDASQLPEVYDPAYVSSEIRSALSAKDQLEQHFVTQNLDGVARVLTMPKYGSGVATTVPGSIAEMQPLSAAVEAQKGRIARAGATNVNVSTEKAYGGAVAAGAAKEDLATVERARTLPQEFAKIDETLNVLKTSDLNTGLGADLFTVLDKARAQVAADKKAGKRAVNTEYLDSLLGSAVFPQIQALGIGARGMDTPAEREFLRKVMTGSITLNKDTLIKMTELRRKGLENEAQQFNKRVEAGEFEPFSQAARRKVGKVEVPTSAAPNIDALLNKYK